jgi:hypothetical protein
MPGSHAPYRPEFRRLMVDLVRSGRTPEELAREFQPSSGAIRPAVDAGRVRCCVFGEPAGYICSTRTGDGWPRTTSSTKPQLTRQSRTQQDSAECGELREQDTGLPPLSSARSSPDPGTLSRRCLQLQVAVVQSSVAFVFGSS